MSLTSQRHVKIYPGCCGSDAYIDVSFNLVIRRKGLFYTVNLVVPCMLIGMLFLVLNRNFSKIALPIFKAGFSAILTTFAFYIPPREHKMTYLMQTLVAITFFYLVLVELIPPSSVAVPLITKYLLLTLCLLVASIVISIYTVRVYRYFLSWLAESIKYVNYFYILFDSRKQLYKISFLSKVLENFHLLLHVLNINSSDLSSNVMNVLLQN